MYLMRFDMRAPAHGAPAADLYAAALEMAAWGEQHGCALAVISEHHASPDGYLPSPLVLATAIAARTERLPINVAALLVLLYDPIKLAEDMAVLDLVSGGRVSYVAGLGYRDEEYAMFGVDARRRGKRMDACLETLQRAWSGEPFEFEGRPVRVTPKPLTPGGPPLAYGGASPAAARRAARFGLNLMAADDTPGLEASYRAEAERVRRKPGVCIIPRRGVPTSVFVAEDVDRAWEALGPHLLHDARCYAEWMGDAPAASKSNAQSVAELRAERGAYQILTPEEAVALARQNGLLNLQPLCGGAPPELGWQTLRLVAEKVLPALG